MIDRIIQSGVDLGLYTHAAYAVAVDGSTVGTGAFGQATVDTIFDLASLTKPMSTATLFLQAVERGDLHFKLTVDDCFVDTPRINERPDDGPTLFHMATHTGGLPPVPAWPPDAARKSHAELIDLMRLAPRPNVPGARYAYSDAGYILLAEIVARNVGKPLADLFHTAVAEPIGLTTTRFLPPSDWRPHIAPTSSKEPAGAVHDPRARDLGGAAGHAGLFGTITDVLRYLEVIRTGGSPLLSRASTARMSTPQIDPAVGAHSIGWFCAGNEYLPAGDLFSPRAFGHSGFTGAMALIDPEYGVSLVVLTNRVINTREGSSRYLDLRRRWTNAFAAAVTSGARS